MPLIVSDLVKDFSFQGGSLSILRNCSFRLEPSQSLAVVGPSGSGKSTLLGILGTLEPATSGSVRLGDQEILSLKELELPTFRRHKIGFVFQEHHLLPQCTVLENVLIPFLSEGRMTDERQEIGRKLLDRVGLSNRLEHRPAELSGGERQRVAIARALVFGPSLLLADEPTGNLDRTTAASVGNLLLELASETMIVLATHDPELAAKTTFRSRLENGTLVSEKFAQEPRIAHEPRT